MSDDLTAAAIKRSKCLARIILNRSQHRFLGCGVGLTDNLAQLRGVHSCALQLRKSRA